MAIPAVTILYIFREKTLKEKIIWELPLQAVVSMTLSLFRPDPAVIQFWIFAIVHFGMATVLVVGDHCFHQIQKLLDR